MNYIQDNLYLGSLDDAWKTEKLKENGITHILTIESKPLDINLRSSFEYKYVHALDMESEDLLSHFAECIKFIDEGRQAGAVFVHCYYGQSRSATIVIAYMMQKLDLSLDDATTLVRKQRPEISPNPSFKSQLELFEAMGNVIDKTNGEYKKYKLNILANKMMNAQLGEMLPDESLSADPSLNQGGNEVFYKCKKCRRPLFKQSCLLSHEVGLGQTAFTWAGKHQQGDKTQENDSCKQSLFLEPVQWMKNHILDLEGKLMCPKCHAKIGSYNWCGERCPCGTWVAPAFHIQKSKVDECKPRLIPAARLTKSDLERTRTKSNSEKEDFEKMEKPKVTVGGHLEKLPPIE